MGQQDRQINRKHEKERSSMRYGAGDLRRKGFLDGPSPLSSPLARVARHSRDTTKNGVRM